MKVISRRKQLIDKAKNEENVPSLEVIEVVLVQCNFVDNQYHPKFEVLCTFMSNKSYCLPPVKSWTKQFSIFENYNTEFDDITITFKDQNGRPLEIEDQVNLILLINK